MDLGQLEVVDPEEAAFMHVKIVGLILEQFVRGERRAQFKDVVERANFQRGGQAARRGLQLSRRCEVVAGCEHLAA